MLAARQSEGELISGRLEGIQHLANVESDKAPAHSVRNCSKLSAVKRLFGRALPISGKMTQSEGLEG
jgi:hypothetical protein